MIMRLLVLAALAFVFSMPNLVHAQIGGAGDPGLSTEDLPSSGGRSSKRLECEQYEGGFDEGQQYGRDDRMSRRRFDPNKDADGNTRRGYDHGYREGWDYAFQGNLHLTPRLEQARFQNGKNEGRQHGREDRALDRRYSYHPSGLTVPFRTGYREGYRAGWLSVRE
jgi:hypothetical protein